MTTTIIMRSDKLPKVNGVWSPRPSFFNFIILCLGYA